MPPPGDGDGDDPFAAPKQPGAEPSALELASIKPRVRAKVDLPAPETPATPVARALRVSDLPKTGPAIGGVVGLLIAMPASLLPPRWRRALRIDNVAVVPGAILSALTVVGLTIWWFAHGVIAQHDRYGGVVGQAMVNYWDNDPVGDPKASWSGLVIFLSFALSPKGVALIWFFGEGILRAAAAGAAGEALCTAPLWFVDRGIDLAGAIRTRVQLGPLVPDRMTRSSQAIEIESCRARAWDDELTLLVDDAPYRVVRRAVDPARARRFVYHLAPLPANVVLRRTIVYRADELLVARREDRRRFWTQYKELWRKALRVRPDDERTRSRTAGR